MQLAYFEGTFIHTPTRGELQVLHDHVVAVDSKGKIRFVTPQNDLSGEVKESISASPHTRVVSPENGFFFPGFIDSHTHAPQYPNTGIFGSSTLLSWLETYTFPMESSFRALDRARTVYDRVVARSLRHGTTCCAYYATLHVPATNLLADICKRRGQRALVGRVCMDMMSPEDYRDASVESTVKDSKACIDHCKSIDPSGEIVRPIITPRFAPSCSKQSLEALGKLHRETGTYAQTHISENKAELAVVRELFPAAADYASVYDEAGLLTDKMILAHAIHLSPAEVDLIERRKTKISHCPISNSCLASGAAKVRELLDANVTVGLGTDMSGGFSPSILETARQAVLVSRHVAVQDGESTKLSVEEALYLATRAGAKVVGLEDKVGAFEVGMDWDAQMIDLGRTVPNDDVATENSPLDVFGWETWPDRVAKWLYCGDDRNVKTVWVKGRQTTTNEMEIVTSR